MEQIIYKSTRGDDGAFSSAEAILKGIADDGGLFVPTSIPTPDFTLQELKNLDYRELAYRVMRCFLTDFTEDELRVCVNSAYDEKFGTPKIAPLVKETGVYFLELFHGPTLAFKDMALTILPYLLKTATRKLKADKEIVILTATSGDTGKAALEGFAGVEGTKIIVFFPEHGVSEIQKRQMVTQEGNNSYVVGIEGNFDDAQSGVKEIFADATLKEKMAQQGVVFSSANSINIGRLIPQVVYYFYAYMQAWQRGDIAEGEEINFTVPTGNFGNILAGYYAKKMGLPIGKLICASNENKVLFDFLKTGIYDKERDFVVTMSPSMDILISSNLERLLYELWGRDAAGVKGMMEELKEKGKYNIGQDMLEALETNFYGGYASEKDTSTAIKDVYDSTGYVMDTHTAVAYSVYRRYADRTGDDRKNVVVSTASPYKFPVDVMKSLGKPTGEDEFKLIEELRKVSNTSVPKGIKDLDKKPILHKTVCQKEEMKEQIKKILNLDTGYNSTSI